MSVVVTNKLHVLGRAWGSFPSGGNLSCCGGAQILGRTDGNEKLFLARLPGFPLRPRHVERGGGRRLTEKLWYNDL